MTIPEPISLKPHEEMVNMPPEEWAKYQDEKYAEINGKMRKIQQGDIEELKTKTDELAKNSQALKKQGNYLRRESLFRRMIKGIRNLASRIANALRSVSTRSEPSTDIAKK